MEKNINFKSGKYNLFGVLHIPENGKKPYPAVVMFHGFTGNKAEHHFLFTQTARHLCNKGIGVLRFDFMGSGDSEGKFEEMTIHTEIQDGRKAIDLVMRNKIFDKNRIGIIGLSMGTVIANYIAVEYKTKALALWSPLAEPALIEQRVLTRTLKNTLLKKGKVYPPGFGHCLGKEFFQSTKNVKPLEMAKSYTGNVLILHTKDDIVLSVDQAFSYFEAFHSKAIMPQLVILAEGGHTFTTEMSEKTVIEDTTSFFQKTLFNKY